MLKQIKTGNIVILLLIILLQTPKIGVGQLQIQIGANSGIITSISEIEYRDFNRSVPVHGNSWGNSVFLSLKLSQVNFQIKTGINQGSLISRFEFRDNSKIPVDSYKPLDFLFNNYQIPISVLVPIIKWKETISVEISVGGFYYWGNYSSFFLKNRNPGQPLIGGVLQSQNKELTDLPFVVIDHTSRNNGMGLHFGTIISYEFLERIGLNFEIRYATVVQAISNIYIHYDNGHNLQGDVGLRSNGNALETKIGLNIRIK